MCLIQLEQLETSITEDCFSINGASSYRCYTLAAFGDHLSSCGTLDKQWGNMKGQQHTFTCILQFLRSCGTRAKEYFRLQTPYMAARLRWLGMSLHNHNPLSHFPYKCSRLFWKLELSYIIILRCVSSYVPDLFSYYKSFVDVLNYEGGSRAGGGGQLPCCLICIMHTSIT